MEVDRKRKQGTEGRNMLKMTKKEGKKEWIFRKKDGWDRMEEDKVGRGLENGRKCRREKGRVKE
jgi:hypothetical protein